MQIFTCRNLFAEQVLERAVCSALASRDLSRRTAFHILSLKKNAVALKWLVRVSMVGRQVSNV